MLNNLNIAKKRQFILWICCLCISAGIFIGAVSAVKNGMAISFLSFNGVTAKLQNTSFLRQFLGAFKYTAIAFASGAVAETHSLMYFLIFYKGFALGYAAFSIADTAVIKRILSTALYLPPELIICTYIIFTAVYFSSASPVSMSARGYKLEKRRRFSEIIILLVLSVVSAAACAMWKIYISPLIFGLL